MKALAKFKKAEAEKRGRAMARARAAADASAQFISPVSAVIAGGVSAAVDSKLDDKTIGDSKVTKGPLGVAVVSIGIALVGRKSKAIRSHAVAAASGALGVTAYQLTEAKLG